MTGTPDLVTAVRSAKQFLTYVASGPFQYAVAEALALPDTYFAALRADMPAKRDVLAAGLTEAGGVAIPNAVFYDHREAGAPFVRFAFCKRTEVLEEAAKRLKAAW
ncbi:hypothetical protein AQJ27_27085 [Streptomyces olivochromogenes]|uniref:Aminotransferase n=1 Tax=Streptomyces olivochromogenes TaxID=1963 RepID=A0A250VGA8_STROL|nr:hypothetical protein AQJ27_27085 [Streptomyces olivochromogenes]GAX53010.1 aminotransferase [Streptomyces olivochromogenes]